MAPLASSELSRIFTYTTDNSFKAVSYNSASGALKPRIVLTPEEKLYLSFDSPYPNGNDDVGFFIDKSKIKPGYIGEYVFRPANETPSSDIAFAYTYHFSATSGRVLFAYSVFLPPYSSIGSVIITKYDIKHKTLSGNFTFSTSTLTDPTDNSLAVYNKNTTINISGKFENIALETIN